MHRPIRLMHASLPILQMVTSHSKETFIPNLRHWNLTNLYYLV